MSSLLLLLSFYLKGQQEGDLILESKMSVHFNDQLISVVLDTISSRINYYFSYDPELVQANRKINISFKDASVEKILNAIFKDKMAYIVLKDQIVINKKAGTASKTKEAEEKIPLFIDLKGKIFDLESNSPISYASISIWKHPIGTISNKDGNFELKVPVENKNDTLVFSCLGYQKYLLPICDFEFEKNNIFLRPVSVKIKEIKVKAIATMDIVKAMIDKIEDNYPDENYLMTSFYRETMQQDKKYLTVSEAVMELLKMSYSNLFRDDQIRLIKGRKNNHEQLFKWVDLKMQGGPYYIPFLDVVRTREAFLNLQYFSSYKYTIEEAIVYKDRPTFVISFKPSVKGVPSYQGMLYVDRETLALVQINYKFTKSGLKEARKSMIKKKPWGFNIRPITVNYQVTYKNDNGKWFFNTAHADVRFRVRSRNDKINSLYVSTSDLLVTDYEKTDLKRFKNSDVFHPNDIFTESIIDYDEDFWGDYNIIKPNENLQKAIK